jgi:ribosome-binding protein aMBF1 (putative translation factor)
MGRLVLKESEETKSEDWLDPQIKECVSRLLRDQRVFTGRSIRSVARRIKVKRSKLRSWESGKSTPPAYVYVAIVTIYGEAALQAAAKLDSQLQLERYRDRYQTKRLALAA